VDLAKDILVIADEKCVVGMAGVMGGEASGIGEATTDVFLEAAHFTPEAVMGRGRRFGLVTDASQRFERGVDPQLPTRAIERATQLILENAGGIGGPVVLTEGKVMSPGPPIRLRQSRVERVLGVRIDAPIVADSLSLLGMHVETQSNEWRVAAPSWRFDIALEEDLIEEIARLYGYDNIAPSDATIRQQLGRCTESRVTKERVADTLVDRGYQEAITYAFVDRKWQAHMFPNAMPRAVVNPISAELGVMRVSLWPGLTQVARDNARRQQSRLRIFEIGRKFVDDLEIEVVAGLIFGAASRERWDGATRRVDFFDMKGDVEAVFALTGHSESFVFTPGVHPALHPGQAAQISRGSSAVGWVGAIHPDVAKKMDLTYPLYLFELEIETALRSRVPEFADISRYPAIRRDLAVIVAEAVQYTRLAEVVRKAAGGLLRDLTVLSVYRGEQIEKGKKSIALGLNLQDTSRTLTDDDADRLIAQVIERLSSDLGGSVRDK
jgi:phenylalanyl-tRNA synthetase beta chain